MARHLYIHMPFCAHRCGYCDFVTAVGRGHEHDGYVDALLEELRLEWELLDEAIETIFLGGGTPTLTRPRALARLLAALPPCEELTVEANPETVTPEVAALLRDHGVNRVSLGAQSFQPHLLEVLERQASPEDVRRAFYDLRVAEFDNISLDLLYGIPGESAADLDADLTAALALGPEHLSCYELEAKPGTRFAHAHGAELAGQAEALEGQFEQVVERLTRDGYRWYETANFCRAPERVHGRDLRARHNLGYWQARDYLGVGVGAVSTVRGHRWRNTPKLALYQSSLGRGRRPPREEEALSLEVRSRERLMLALRLDEPVAIEAGDALDESGLGRMESLGLAQQAHDARGARLVGLTPRGRFLGGAVTAQLVT
jgi:oxygen-independent coproporphyrinogen-3 oxidase